MVTPHPGSDGSLGWGGALEGKRRKSMFTIFETEHPGLADGFGVRIPSLNIPTAVPSAHWAGGSICQMGTCLNIKPDHIAAC